MKEREGGESCVSMEKDWGAGEVKGVESRFWRCKAYSCMGRRRECGCNSSSTEKTTPSSPHKPFAPGYFVRRYYDVRETLSLSLGGACQAHRVGGGDD